MVNVETKNYEEIEHNFDDDNDSLLHWKKYRISNLGKVVTGRTPPSSKPQCFGDKYPFITPSDMDGQKKADVVERYLSDDGANLLKSSLVPAESVSVSCIGWQMGKSIMTSRPSFTNQQLNTIIPNDKVDADFLYYSLSTRRKELLSLGATTGVRTPILNKSVFSDLEIILPPLPTQHKIASILSAYDDLIENNTRRIQILEEMAQALYREWFVEFRFPGHEKVKMVESELGVMPEGWEVKKLGELYRTSSGGTPSRKIAEYYGGTINWVKTKELNDNFLFKTEEKITDIGLQKSSAKIFPENTVIMAMYGATIGKLAILAQPASTNQACCAIIKINDLFQHHYIFSFLLVNREKIFSLGAGAAQQNISQTVIQKMKILKPSDTIMKMFNEFVAPNFEHIKSLQLKNTNLRRTRDMLLPKLISGEVEVKNLETLT